jgi:amino acid transporter
MLLRDSGDICGPDGRHQMGNESNVPAGAVAEETTTLALAEKGKLVKSLRQVDMFFFTLCAFVGLDTLGVVASNGAQGFTWLIVLAVLFVLPYALLMAEIGGAFTQEGGPYEWVKMAFGRFHGGLTAVLYWIRNPRGVGGSLVVLATGAWGA